MIYLYNRRKHTYIHIKRDTHTYIYIRLFICLGVCFEHTYYITLVICTTAPTAFRIMGVLWSLTHHKFQFT